MHLVLNHWPWVAGVLGLVVVYLFMRKASVSYSRKISDELEKFVRQPAPLASFAPLSAPPPSPADSPMVADHKQKIWQMIQDHPLPPVQQIESLVNILATTQVDQRFALLYQPMLRSQFDFLGELCAQNGSVSRESAEEFLRKTSEQHETLKTLRFSDWIGFLVQTGLVSPGVATFEVTPIGRGLLAWASQKQLPEKPHERL